MSKLKIELSPYMRQLAQKVSELTGRSLTDTVNWLLFRVEMLGRHRKLAEFGLEWVEAASLIHRELGAQDDDVAAEGGHIAFNVELLEKDAKTKSNFAGVYVTSAGAFRALVPDVTGARYLQSRKTGLEAAIDRFRWFEANGLPYGNIGRNVEHWKKMRPQWSMEEILISLVEDAKDGSSKDVSHPFTLEQAEHLLTRYREKHKETSTTVKPETTPIEEVVICSFCTEAIEDADDLSIFGKNGGYAHKACVLDAQ